MAIKIDKVHETSLHPARSLEHHTLHLAALEWSLAEAIVIQSAEDIQSRATWRDRVKPFEHQVQNLITFCRRLPVTLLTDDVGLGKTISAGLILSELIVRRRVRRALVLCPKILCPQWVDELATKFAITAKIATGVALAEEFGRQTPVVVTTYDSARDRLTKVKPDVFDIIILDEAHKLRNLHGNKNPPALAVAVREALERRLFKFVLMLTATPIHNRLSDIYSLVDCLTVAKGHKNPLGTLEDFRQRFLLPGHDGRRLNPLTAEQFRIILRDYLVRMRRGDARLKFPSREVKVFRVDPSAQERQLTGLVAKQIGKLNPLQQTSLAQALMSSPQALATQLENMARQGSVPASAAAEARASAEKLAEPAKLGRLLFLLKELKASRPDDWRAVVFTLRKETQKLIGEALRRGGVSVGYIQGGEPRQNQSAIERFRANPPQVRVLVSTDAGAEGINLQAANVLVNYDLPWNPMVVEQRIGRLQRLASEHEYVVICNLVVAGSIEERVVGRLMEKLQGIAQAIGDIESILESAGWEGEGEEKSSFESQIRELVVKSLLGQDVAEATRLKQESIEKAQKLIDERRQEIDSTLGRLDALHNAGPQMPKLQRLPPGIPAKEFVLRAKQAEGARVEPRPDGAYDVGMPGAPREVVAFEENLARTLAGQAVFMGNVRLYQPGTPWFERHVQHWVDQSGHHLLDTLPRTQALSEQVARAWCKEFTGAEFQGVEVTHREKKFQGRVCYRVKASNGLDSYEKLIRGNFHPEGHSPIASDPAAQDLITGDVLPSQILPDYSGPLHQTLLADKDLNEFCRFYEERLREEADRVGDDARRLHKVQTDFTPSVAAEVVGAQGTRYEECLIKIRFTIDGKGPYEETVRAVPASGQILRDLARDTCQVTNRTVPASCLVRCEISKQSVLKHLTVVSEVNGRRALTCHAVKCEWTGKTVLTDEVATSAVSGKKAIAKLLRPSPYSGRLGLPDEFGRCHFTGKEALSDELIPSQVSGELFLAREVAKSAVSGVVGHWSEFANCQVTHGYILPSESEESARSRKNARKDLFKPSEKPPGLPGLDEDFGVCEITRKRLLLDRELGRSELSGKLVDKDLLHPSVRSGRLALEDELIECEETGAKLFPQETGLCSLTGKRVDATLLSTSAVSGSIALTRLMTRCAITREPALRSELLQCQLTKAWVIPSHLGTCAITGQRVLLTELISCKVTGDRIIREESGKSDYSGWVVRKDLLSRSDGLEGHWGLDEEFGICDLTRKRLLLDELDKSAVSGKRVDKRLLVPSASSGRLALPEEMFTCEKSGALLLPEETDVCSLTQKRVDVRLLGRSEVSGALALKELLERCAATQKRVLPSELAECELSHLRVLPSELAACAVTRKRVLRSRLVSCAVTDDLILPAVAGRSAYSKKVVRRDLLSASERDANRLGLKEEFGICSATGKRLLLDELGRSAVSRKLFDKDMLRPSARSGELALESEMVRCQVSRAFLFPSETGLCGITGKRVDARLLARSEISGSLALKSQMKRCAMTGTLALPSEVEQCALTGLWALPQEMETCAVTGKRALRKELLRSDVSGKYVIPGKALRSAISGKVCLPKEAVKCAWSQQIILSHEAKGCRLTGMKIAKQYLNSEDELKVLRDLLNDRAAAAWEASELVPLLQSWYGGDFRRLKNAWAVKSPDGAILAVCGEIRSFLGLRNRYVGFLLKNHGEESKLMGEYSIGRRTNEGWVQE